MSAQTDYVMATTRDMPRPEQLMATTRDLPRPQDPMATTRDIVRTEQPAENYVQKGHTLTTVKETEKSTKRNRRGNPVVKTKTRTVYYVDGKEVRVNWFDKLRIRFMSTYEKQAFLAKKLLRQEKAAFKKANRRK